MKKLWFRSFPFAAFAMAGLLLSLAPLAPAGTPILIADETCQADPLGMRSFERGNLSREAILKYMAEQGVSADVRLIGGEIFPGFAVKAGYYYKVEPSFHEGLFTRYDQYYMNVDVGGTTGVTHVVPASAGEIGVGLDLTNDLELRFNRQFKSSSKALFAKPYGRSHLPFDAERALKGLRTGNHFMMKSKLALLVTGGFLHRLNPAYMFQASAHYLVAGTFYLHILRLKGQKLQFRILGLNTKQRGVGLGIGFVDSLTVFKIAGSLGDLVNDRLNSRLKDLLELQQPVQFDMAKGHNDLFFAEYVIDMEKKEGPEREAYDQILSQISKMKNVTETITVDAFRDRLRNTLLVNIEPIDQLARDQETLPLEERTVRRNFKGDMASEYRNQALRLGNSLLRFEHHQERSQNKIVSIGEGEKKTYYRLNSYSARTDNEFLMSWWRNHRGLTYDSLVRTDEQSGNPEAEDLVVAAERRDSSFTIRDLQQVRTLIHRTLPEFIEREIPFSQWDQNNRTLGNVKAISQLIIHPSGMAALPALSAEEIYKRYVAYLKDADTSDLWIHDNGYSAANGSPNEQSTESRLKPEIKAIAKQMAKALALQAGDRQEAFLELRKLSLFVKTGLRFVLELLPNDSEKMKEWIRYDLLLDGGGKKLSFVYGYQKQGELYSRLLTIRNIVNDEGIDLRMEGENLHEMICRGDIHQ